MCNASSRLRPGLSRNSHINVLDNNIHYRLAFANIVFLQSDENTTMFFEFSALPGMPKRTITGHHNLGYYAPLLSPDFMQVQRSFIINELWFDSYDKDGLIKMKVFDECNIYVGCTFKPEFVAWFNAQN